MLDSYSLDADWAGLDAQYRAHFQSYFNIFNRCGLPTIAVSADVGMMGGKLSHEYMYLTPIGEDTLLLCDHCGYTANRQVAAFRKPAAEPETALPMQKVSTPGVKTIDELTAFLKITPAKTAKAVFMVASVMQGDTPVDQFIFAVVRGDMELNETKLSNAVKARELRPAQEDEIRAIGAVPGYGSPLGVRNCFIVVDEAVAQSANLVAGANVEGFHMLNVNYGRDYTAHLVCDIAVANEGAACPTCGTPMRTARGVEVGNIFQLGTRYSDAMGGTYQDEAGQARPVVMGSYGIGVGRLLACIAEEHHDDFGLCWPISVAPYQVQLILLRGDQASEAVAEQLYTELQRAGVEVLFDDRAERPGVKFMDADLIGLPLRVTVGDRALKRGGVELKQRTSKDVTLVPVAEAVAHIQNEIAKLMQEIDATVQTVPYHAA